MRDTIFDEVNGWIVAASIILIPPIFALLLSAGSRGLFGRHQVEATAHILDVAIAMTAAYVGLKRHRLKVEMDAVFLALGLNHLGANELCRKVEAAIEDKDVSKILPQQRAALLLYAYGRHHRASKLVKTKALESQIIVCELCNSTTMKACKIFMHDLIDRKICMIILAALCFSLVTVTCMDLRSFKLHIAAHWVWVMFYLIVLGFLAPMGAWLASDQLIKHLGQSARSWSGAISQHDNSRVLAAAMP